MSGKINFHLWHRGIHQLAQGKFTVIYHKLLRMLGLKHLLPPFPMSLMIEPANVCNLHCPTCPTGSGKLNRRPRLLQFQEFKAIVDQSRSYIEEIVLWNYGEPFLNPDLLKMIKYATSSGIHVLTSTNGEFFDSPDFALQVVESGLQHLIICLDGADQDTLNIYRKGSNFESITRGIELVIRAKQQLRSKTPRVELQFILMKQNEHQRSRMKEIAGRLGVDLYCEKTVGIDANNPKFQEQASKYLPGDLSLSRYFLKPDGTYALKGEIKNYCQWVYERAVINSDGNVVPCCYDLDSRHVMGNIFREDMRLIWLNDKYQAFRKKIGENRKNIPICNSCSEGRYEITRKKVSLGSSR